MPRVLTTASQAQCPHGGQALLFTSNATLLAGGSPVLLQSDMHPVVGCPFTVGVVYSPCVLVQWSGGATSLTVSGVGALTQASVGMCLNPTGAPQGPAIVSAPEPSLEAV